RRPDQRIRYQIVTNGTLLTDEHLQLFDDYGFELQISFDGVKAAQDFRSRDSFRVLDAWLDRLRTDWPRIFQQTLSVSITLVVDALPHLADSIDYFIAKQVREVAISPAVTYQTRWRDDVMPELERQFSRILAACVDEYRRTGAVPLVLFRRTSDG